MRAPLPEPAGTSAAGREGTETCPLVSTGAGNAISRLLERPCPGWPRREVQNENSLADVSLYTPQKTIRLGFPKEFRAVRHPNPTEISSEKPQLELLVTGFSSSFFF